MFILHGLTHTCIGMAGQATGSNTAEVARYASSATGSAITFVLVVTVVATPISLQT